MLQWFGQIERSNNLMDSNL